MVDWGREKLMRHFLEGENVGLVIGRQGQVVGSMQWNLIFVSDSVTDFNLYYRGGGMAFPLYLYPETPELDGAIRTPNLDPKIVAKIAADIGLTFEAEKSDDAAKFAPIDLLDYIYAVLHSPAYREKYKEFLKIDFPRVPYPTSAEEFRRLSALGSELRQIHLMEHPKLSKLITQYPIDADNTVERPRWEVNADGEAGKVWINAEQYFDNVPLVAWELYIGGYQPAQKWLKDRNNHTLTYDDIMHYQRIIVALTMTNEIMNKINPPK